MMRTLLSSGVLLALLVGESVIAQNTTTPDVDRVIAQMFQDAKLGKLEAIEKTKNEFTASNALQDSTFSLSYALARYIASPEQYKQQYVEAFPTDSAGIMNILYEGIELRGWLPRFMFSVETIRSIAA